VSLGERLEKREVAGRAVFVGSAYGRPLSLTQFANLPAALSLDISAQRLVKMQYGPMAGPTISPLYPAFPRARSRFYEPHRTTRLLLTTRTEFNQMPVAPLPRSDVRPGATGDVETCRITTGAA
jgi:hypothetical protein